MHRRELISAVPGVFAGGLAGASAAAAPPKEMPRVRTVSAADFGAVGDGRADDTRALQASLDATIGSGTPGLLVIPPGTYKVTRGLRVDLDRQRAGKVIGWTGISAPGAEIRSAIDGDDVLAITSRTLARFVLLEGLRIKGSGLDGAGISIHCDGQGAYFYNAALRDVVVEGCGGDGCRMIGNIFESQIFNSYFRDNRRNGATMGHGTRGGVLSAVHVFGCVFGGNREHGAAIVSPANDVSFHGCYFLENGRYGLAAANGCSLLSHCGFENNHMRAKDFSAGDAGVKLNTAGTLIACTAYSIHRQTHLLNAYVVNRLVMVGCTGDGHRDAKGARLARIGGERGAEVTIVGSSGGVDYKDAVDGLEIGNAGGGLRVGSRWDASNGLRMGDYTLWVDDAGRLRMKNGTPGFDSDGTVIGE